MLLAAGGIWFAQQRGWIAKSAPQGAQQNRQAAGQAADQQSRAVQGDSGTTPASRPGATESSRALPEPKAQQASTPAAKPAAAPTPKPAATKPASRPKGTVTAAEIDASNTANMSARERAERTPVSGDQLDELYKLEKNLVWVEGTGKVIRVLSDDTDGSKHQRFTMANSDGHEVMVAHNIDLSPRAPVKEGDTIAYRGEYIWTDRGGKVHFTHKPQYGNFRGGWIEVGGKRYE